MNIETIKSVYFVGAGGIGMSALVRYLDVYKRQVQDYRSGRFRFNCRNDLVFKSGRSDP